VRRREFITLLGSATAWPLAVSAQQPGRLPTVGLLGSGSPSYWSRWVAAFVQRLLELGWIDASVHVRLVVETRQQAEFEGYRTGGK
jgi:putative tryptophan/tyrosine transport system substrate-binding protein